MFKIILFIFFLIASFIFPCNANEENYKTPANLVVNNFEISEITDLSHPVCTLNLDDNSNEHFYNYIEGDICPVGGGNCTYSAVMKLNGKITILKKVYSEENASFFKNENFFATTKPTTIAKSIENDEGSYVSAVISIETKNGEKKFDMAGYCGI